MKDLIKKLNSKNGIILKFTDQELNTIEKLTGDIATYIYIFRNNGMNLLDFSKYSQQELENFILAAAKLLLLPPENIYISSNNNDIFINVSLPLFDVDIESSYVNSNSYDRLLKNVLTLITKLTPSFYKET